MATFTYMAKSRDGKKVDGSINADDRRGALRQIEAMGHFPVSVTETQQKKPAKVSGARKPLFRLERKGPRRMRMFDVLIFSTELSDLLGAGMTLGNGLNLLSKRETGRASDAVIPILRDDIVQGASLSTALAKHPKSFSTLYVSMIKAGEASGTLADVLKRLVQHYERMQETRDKIITALVYPIIVLCVGILVLLFALLYVVPKFQVIFEDLGGTLPLSMQLLINSSKWLASYGWIAGAVLVILAVLAKRALKTERGTFWRDGVLLKLPLMKGIISAGIYSNFSRTLSTLLSNGVPVLQALGIVQNTVGNVVIAKEIANAKERVTDGTTISGPLAQGKVFPRMMTDMMAVGEQTGNVPGSLLHVAHRYEHQLDRSIKIFTTALEPIMIFFMAILVGFVALTILSAVFNLTSGLDAPTE